MTESAWTFHPTMSAIALGPVLIDAPSRGRVHHVRGVYGELWQLVGDGHALISAAVSSKQTPMGTADGVREHLDWEALRQASGTRFVDLASSPTDEVAAQDTHVAGALHAAKVVISSVRHGIRLHNILIGTSNGDWMQVIHLAMRDTDSGRALGMTMCASIQIGGSAA